MKVLYPDVVMYVNNTGLVTLATAAETVTHVETALSQNAY